MAAFLFSQARFKDSGVAQGAHHTGHHFQQQSMIAAALTKGDQALDRHQQITGQALQGLPLYQYTLLSEAPRHPLYDVTFLVGAKTTDDAGNYAMTDLITDLGDLFKSGDSFELFDYSEVEEGQDPGGQIGVLVIGSVDTGPQMFEKQSGIRLLQIEGKVIA